MQQEAHHPPPGVGCHSWADSKLLTAERQPTWSPCSDDRARSSCPAQSTHIGQTTCMRRRGVALQDMRWCHRLLALLSRGGRRRQGRTWRCVGSGISFCRVWGVAVILHTLLSTRGACMTGGQEASRPKRNCTTESINLLAPCCIQYWSIRSRVLQRLAERRARYPDSKRTAEAISRCGRMVHDS